MIPIHKAQHLGMSLSTKYMVFSTTIAAFQQSGGRPVSNDGDFHHDLIMIFKAGLELFVVLLKKKEMELLSFLVHN